MPHPEIENTLGFPSELLFLADESSRPLCVVLLQASYVIGEGGALSRCEAPVPIELAGTHHGDPACSSPRLESPIAFFKPTTDVVLLGHAHAPRPQTTELQVGLRVGALQKVVRVTGDRVMSKVLGRHSISHPATFETLPLIYERAFGGTDTRDPKPGVLRCEPRNPVGRGYRDPTLGQDEEVLLPNLEDPDHPFRGYGDQPPPAGFGFIAPHWQPRARLAGTYDEAWDKSRKPLLPLDFDRRFFNAASPGLISPSYLRGDEQALVANASPEGRIEFQLPDTATPHCQLSLRGHRVEEFPLLLDTVIIDLDARRLLLQRRGHAVLQRGPEDVTGVRILRRRPG
ncbi:DUF2169 domain-containing protein [Niveibacterium umoris]|uniref:DUF2169 domain-containing protein n=1 Tax=Niveibacterium umoris TaxID=1193620 RepID=A0A840BHD9_9RHOO|nr:DUF2169 domain-containing protein [Niveibacterium umoris]MBB4011664.1 hypothetical protein [Niveibacterium umoris]